MIVGLISVGSDFQKVSHCESFVETAHVADQCLHTLLILKPGCCRYHSLPQLEVLLSAVLASTQCADLVSGAFPQLRQMDRSQASAGMRILQMGIGCQPKSRISTAGFLHNQQLLCMVVLPKPIVVSACFGDPPAHF